MPNIFISISHLILYAQPTIFVATQTMALIGTNIFTAILPPWDKEWRNPPKEKMILLYADKKKAEYWNGTSWEEDLLLSK